MNVAFALILVSTMITSVLPVADTLPNLASHPAAKRLLPLIG